MMFPVHSFMLLLCLLLPALPLFASSDAEQLQQIRERIEQTTDDLSRQKSAESKLLKDLAVVATKIRKIDRRIDDIRTQKKVITQNLRKIRAEQAETEKNLGSLRRNLEKRLVALYKEGELGPLKIIFSADSPMELVQQYSYLGRILQADRHLLVEFRSALEQQRSVQQRYTALEQEQEVLLGNERESRRDIAAGRDLQKKILAKVRLNKKELARELDELKARERRLQTLVKRLEKERQPVPQEITDSPFATLKGALPWPLDGSVSIGFGTQEHSSLGTVLESHGIEIEYKRSQPVRSVASGRIVFASWFKGYGNLMIIAHDQGYHTLYAQLDNMSGSVGDTVNQGTVIAESGPVREDGLYFEIRHNGSPIDPLDWLRRR